MADRGRGAWPKSGAGGTLKPKGKATVPGPYYTLASDPNQTVGLRATLLFSAGRGTEVSLDEVAVWHGVVAIQVLLRSYFWNPAHRPGATVAVNGLFDEPTHDRVRIFQRAEDLKDDGIVGPATMKALLLPHIKAKAAQMPVPWEPVYGILRWEGGFDPGAVGVADTLDLGLAQINVAAHPDVTISEAFCPSFAVDFVARYLATNNNRLGGNLSDAVASFNLGYGGTRQWIAAGRPDRWQPPWADTERDVAGYITRILSAAEGVA